LDEPRSATSFGIVVLTQTIVVFNTDYSGFNTDYGFSEPLKTLVMLCYVIHNPETLCTLFRLLKVFIFFPLLNVSFS